MATGAFWNDPSGKKPWGELDVNDELDFTFDWTSWLAEIAETLATPSPEGHVLELVDPDTGVNPLEVVSSQQAGTDTQVVFRLRVDPALYVAADHKGKKFGVTCRITSTPSLQKKDKTLWFKLVEH